MVKILHMSDTHGIIRMPEYDDYDIVVHSGDLFPNTCSTKNQEEYQAKWLESNWKKFAKIAGNRPLIYVPGNHDYYDPQGLFIYNGIEAYTLVESSITLEGLKFFGFPYVLNYNYWNYERSEAEIGELLDRYDLDNFDVLVFHSPMHRVLDQNQYGINCGSEAIRNRVENLCNKAQAYLHGHIHESKGMTGLGHIVVSNAACGYNLVEV